MTKQESKISCENTVLRGVKRTLLAEIEELTENVKKLEAQVVKLGKTPVTKEKKKAEKKKAETPVEEEKPAEEEKPVEEEK